MSKLPPKSLIVAMSIIMNCIPSFGQLLDVHNKQFDFVNQIITIDNKINEIDNELSKLQQVASSKTMAVYKEATQQRRDAGNNYLFALGGIALQIGEVVIKKNVSNDDIVKGLINNGFDAIIALSKDSRIDKELREKLIDISSEKSKLEPLLSARWRLLTEKSNHWSSAHASGLFNNISQNPISGIFSTQSPVRTPPSPHGKWKLTQQGERSKATLDVSEGAIAAIEIACKGKDALSYKFASRGSQIKEIQPLTANSSPPRMTLDASGIVTQGAGALVGAVDVWERAYSDMSLQMSGQTLPPMQISMLVTNASNVTTRPVIELAGMTAVRDSLRRLCAGLAEDDMHVDKPPQPTNVAQPSLNQNVQPPNTNTLVSKKRVVDWAEVVGIFVANQNTCPIGMISGILPDRLFCMPKIPENEKSPNVRIWAYRKDLSESNRADKRGPYVFSSFEVIVSIRVFGSRNEAAVAALFTPILTQLGLQVAIKDMARALKSGKNEYGVIQDSENSSQPYLMSSYAFLDGGREFKYTVYW